MSTKTATVGVADPDHPAPTQGAKGKSRVQGGLLDPKMLWKSMPDAVRKLDPRTLWRNPVMFIVEVGAVWSTVLAVLNSSWFAWLIVFWLWLTVIFANLAEAVAEGRGKAQADSLRKAKSDAVARKLVGWAPGRPAPKKRSPHRCCSRATSSWWKPDRSSPVTVTSWKALPPWMSRPSPVNPHR